MIYALIALVAALATSTFIYRRKYMDVKAVLAKVIAANDAADGVAARLAAKDAQIATLEANQIDPSQLQTIADGLDSVIAKIS